MTKTLTNAKTFLFPKFRLTPRPCQQIWPINSCFNASACFCFRHKVCRKNCMYEINHCSSLYNSAKIFVNCCSHKVPLVLAIVLCRSWRLVHQQLACRLQSFTDVSMGKYINMVTIYSWDALESIKFYLFAVYSLKRWTVISSALCKWKTKIAFTV